MASANDLLPALELIVARHGSGLLDDRRRLVGLLRDHAPDRLADIRLFIAAFDAGTPGRLKASPRRQDEVARESETLAASAGCAPDFARHAVAAWASILSAPRPMPIPLPGTPGIQQMPMPLPLMQPMPGAQMPSPIQPLPGLMPAPLPLAASGGVPARTVPSRTILWGLFGVAVLILAFVLVRALAS